VDVALLGALQLLLFIVVTLQRLEATPNLLIMMISL
jgi:hypothetical protein